MTPSAIPPAPLGPGGPKGRILAVAAAAVAMAGCAGAGNVGSPSAEVVPIESPAGPGSRLPSLSAAFGRIALGWVEDAGSGRSVLRCSLWSGDGWGPARTVVASDDLTIDPVDPPSVVPLDAGAIAAVWAVRNPGASYARDIRFAVSTDAGESWSAPACPHRDATATEHGFAAIVPIAGGPWAQLVWLDGRASALAGPDGERTQLLSARWNGDAFGPEELVDPKVCDCCRTAGRAATDGVLVAYRDRSDAEVRDISLATRGPVLWSAPVSVHADGWALTACPTNGPAIAAEGATVAVAWFTAAGGEPKVQVAFSDDRGASFASPVRLDAGDPLGRIDGTSLGGGAAAFVWAERTGRWAEIRLRRVTASGEVSPPLVVGSTAAGRTGGHPRVAAAGPDRVLVAWTDPGSPSRVRVAAASLER